MTLNVFDLELRPHGIVLKDRLSESCLLLQERNHGVLELLGERRSAKRRQRREMQSMDDRPAERSLLCVFAIVVYRVPITGQSSKIENVSLGNFSRQARISLPFSEVL